MKHQTELEFWRSLGWNNPFWELLRYYCSLRGKEQNEFLVELSAPRRGQSKWWSQLNISDVMAAQIGEYCKHRNQLLKDALDSLRTEEEAKLYCASRLIEWNTTKTKSKDHHQSSKTLIATVGSIAQKVCQKFNETLEDNPQRRCIWCIDNHLHVTARNLDGAIPALRDPYIVWEIKEYWGKTSGGSKMSDAVYECQLVGREIREFELKSKHKVSHIVFLDGKEQWNTRKSDLARFIDLHNQGLIDFLFIGAAIETQWEDVLTKLLQSRKDC